jgi:hypothetical protein
MSRVRSPIRSRGQSAGLALEGLQLEGDRSRRSTAPEGRHEARACRRALRSTGAPVEASPSPRRRCASRGASSSSAKLPSLTRRSGAARRTLVATQAPPGGVAVGAEHTRPGHVCRIGPRDCRLRRSSGARRVLSASSRDEARRKTTSRDQTGRGWRESVGLRHDSALLRRDLRRADPAREETAVDRVARPQRGILRRRGSPSGEGGTSARTGPSILPASQDQPDPSSASMSLTARLGPRAGRTPADE